jgi:hypothetical protein
LYSYSKIIRVVKARRMKWERDGKQGGNEKCLKMLEGKSERKRQPMRRREDDIKIDRR